MTPDYDKAATKAAETLIKYCVRKSPISPLPILGEMDNVIVTSFADMCNVSGISQQELRPLFGRSQDSVTSIHHENGRSWYVVAYNSLLPFSMVQHALAREMGHIVLRHEGSSEKNTAEAIVFAQHLLCPRALIHAIKTTNMRITKNVLANLTGIFDHCLSCMRRTPPTRVPARLNAFIRQQFTPFIVNFFNCYASILPTDGSAVADFGTFMDGYEE